MKTLVAVVVLATLALPGALGVTNNELIDYRLRPNYNKVSPFAADKECDATGLLCKNCRDLVFCTSIGGGIWTERPVMSCPTGQICRNNQCVTDQSTDCSPTAEVAFPCLSIGTFPNPGDCKYYHMCSTDANGLLQESKILCENSETFYYNPRTTFCDNRLPTNGQCPGYPIPLCKTVGETAPVEENPTLYYVCLPDGATDPNSVLYPFQMACENGKIYSAPYGCI